MNREEHSDLFPTAEITGDKMPAYWRRLDELVGQPGIHVLFIYRDCRAVVRSALAKARTTWRGAKHGEFYSDPLRTAESWRECMGVMETHSNHILKLRYEDVIKNPADARQSIADYLQIDPAGFSPYDIRGDGRSRHEALSGEVLERLLAIAGPAMEQHGYLRAA